MDGSCVFRVVKYAQRSAWFPALLVLSACVATRPLPEPAPVATSVAWEARMPALQQASQWALEGRAAASIGKQGWQASLAWTQKGDIADLHLAGPLGLGAGEVRLGPEGLSLDGAAARDDAAEILRQRLGFDLPLASLRYWVLGVPDPAAPSEVTRNALDRALQLIQSGWTIDIARYLPVNGDGLPGQLTILQGDVRIRIAIDRWDFPP